MNSVRCAIVLAAVFASGCQSVQQTPSQLILGMWQSEVGGFPLVVEYTDSMVRITGHGEVGYNLENDRLNVDTPGAVERVVSFPSQDEMRQTDPLTGSVHTFTRVR